MSIIAWDGRIIAADRQCTFVGLRVTIAKLWPHDQVVLGITGHTKGVELVEWFKRGAKPDDFPPNERDKDEFSRLHVLSPDGFTIYERCPYPLRIEDPFTAWGAGQDFAMGAMAMGASAIQAVEIASRFSNGCGMGIDAFELTPEGPRRAPFVGG